MNRKKYYAMLTCAVISWLTVPVYAQGTEQNNHVIQVEANRAKEQAKYESQSTTIITKEDIERKKGKSVEDVIFNEVGITRTVDAMGRVGISIRGSDPRHTLIMIDGQPVLGDVSKYSGNGDELQRIGAENIERIEIVRGAASAKYGADAIGGVVNIITKQPKDQAGVQFNAEIRHHTTRYTSGNESSAIPSNFFLRADSGKIGKFKVVGWTSKRYILPVYASEKNKVFGPDVPGEGWTGNWYEEFKPSLRYYGDVRSGGVSGEYEFNKDHKITFRMQTEKEDMERRNKNAYYPIASFLEPMQVFKRDIKRDTYTIIYNGRNSKSDWKVDVNYGKSRENDASIFNNVGGTGKNKYSGFNELGGLDWLEHTQHSVNLSMNTQINDAHFLSYGVGYKKEEGEGTRLKNTPYSYIQKINPWNYDKSLQVERNTATNKDMPKSYVHDYDIIQTEHGVLWNKNGEYYGGNGKEPPFSYDDAVKLRYDKTLSKQEREKLQNKYDKFNDQLTDYVFSNAEVADSRRAFLSELVYEYYGIGYEKNKLYKWDGKQFHADGQYFGEDFDKRKNQIRVGKTEIKKAYAYIQDNWQITERTMITPSLRLDHSDLFGSQVTGNIGVLHHIGGDPHRRFKANFGTGYTEPGMGELYYNWEMFGGTMGNPGWYWIGNPHLKPEKSVNFDVSLEGETDKTYAKISLFHNEIKNYMTSYFTGQLIDFAWGPNSFNMAPDRIYSFRNLGKAKITGIESEVQQKFNKNWAAKMGYTYLYAINDSDSDMPRRLLNRPRHKFDISLNYKNNAGNFRGAFWGSYYNAMLDSNSVSTKSLYDKDKDGNYIRNKNIKYDEKSFGIWNLLLERDFGKDVTAYVGVDNVFNHQDDDRAFQDRVYRLGVHIKLADVTQIFDKSLTVLKDANGNPIIPKEYGEDWFLSRPFSKQERSEKKAGDLKFFGDYRLRSNMFSGDNRLEMRMSRTTAADAGAARNFADKSDHGFEQRLRVGADYQLAKDINLQIVGATSKRDTSYTVAEEKGFHDPYLERARLTKSTDKWDWSLGRIHEPMGVTGYWFGKEYDGARVSYSGAKTQITVGYGDFGQTTGITDSAYAHLEKGIIYRSPTYNELLGMYTWPNESSMVSGTLWQEYEHPFDPKEPANYVEKFNKAGWIQDGKGGWIAPGQPGNSNTPEQIAKAKLAVLQELAGLCKQINEPMWKQVNAGEMLNAPKFNLKVKLKNGEIVDLSQNFNPNIPFSTKWSIPDIDKYGGINGMIQEKNVREYVGEYAEIITQSPEGKDAVFLDKNGNSLSKEEALQQMFIDYVGGDAAYVRAGTSGGINNIEHSNRNSPGNLNQMFINLADSYHPYSDGKNSGGNLPIPLPGIPETYMVSGYFLKQDIIPAMDRAAYIKVKHQMSDTVGVEVWKLNSFGDGANIKGDTLKIADVIGLGAKVRLGKYSMFSFDYGQNRSAMGRYFHGARDIYGAYAGGGSAPNFWVARLDIGIADPAVRGSWNAYLDYKSFEHGAFLGGTGADLPDRYLDGIRSFTAGVGYVPAPNFLLEASYTFNSHSTQQRDTLYTPEHFRLGDYTRVQLTYKF